MRTLIDFEQYSDIGLLRLADELREEIERRELFTTRTRRNIYILCEDEGQSEALYRQMVKRIRSISSNRLIYADLALRVIATTFYRYMFTCDEEDTTDNPWEVLSSKEFEKWLVQKEELDGQR